MLPRRDRGLLALNAGTVILRVFGSLGVPIAQDKLQGLSRCLTFLGIEIDSVNSCVRLPSDKLSTLSSSVRHWSSRKKCRKSELLSLIGSLSFACKVVKPGRIFLRRLIDLSTTVTSLHHHIDLLSSTRADLSVWHSLLQIWNGVTIIQALPISALDLELFTDASFRGFGAYFGGHWVSSSWPVNVSSFNIATLELFAVYASVVVWGHLLRNRQIIIYTDNEAIVHVWGFGSSRDKSLMVLVRLLFFICVKFNISLSLRHLLGVANVYADLLSRLQVHRFLAVCPDATLLATQVPTSLWEFFTTT